MGCWSCDLELWTGFTLFYFLLALLKREEEREKYIPMYKKNCRLWFMFFLISLSGSWIYVEILCRIYKYLF